jgi:fructokinase
VSYRIGIDLGGTKIESILLDPAGEERDRRRIPTPPDRGQAAADRYADIVDALCQLVSETANQIPPGSPAATGRTAPGRTYTLGVGIPGIIDSATDLVVNANTTCLIDRPLGKDLESRLGHPIAIENDANCFTMAEAKQGAAHDYDFVFGVIMGTGVGGALYWNGQVRSGPHGIAGEWGHFSIDPGGAECWCGNRGCVETKLSGSGVEAAYQREFGERRPMHAIVAGFRAGDESCTIVMRNFLRDFGQAMGGLISVLDPDAVVLGGGLSNIDELYDQGREQVQAFAFHPRLRTPILKNELGDSAGVFGAAWIGI